MTGLMLISRWRNSTSIRTLTMMLSAAACLHAAPIDLKGSLLDESCKPVADAIVSLLGAGLETTSAADGTFEFQNAKNTRRYNLDWKPVYYCRLRGGRAIICMPAHSTRLRIRVFSTRRVLVGDIFDRKVDAGEICLPLQPIGRTNGIDIVHVTAGRHSFCSMLYGATASSPALCAAW